MEEVERRWRAEEAERQYRALYAEEHQVEDEEVDGWFLSDSSWAAKADAASESEPQRQRASAVGVSDFILSAMMEGHRNPWDEEQQTPSALDRASPTQRGGGEQEEINSTAAEQQPERSARREDCGRQSGGGGGQAGGGDDGPLPAGAEWDATGKAWDWVQLQTQTQRGEMDKRNERAATFDSISGTEDPEWTALYR